MKSSKERAPFSAIALEALEKVYQTRFVDEKCFKLSRQSKGGTFQLSTAGHELVGVMAALALRSGIDWGLPYYRDRGFVVGLGAPTVDLFAAFLARETEHHSGGRMMPEHFVHRELRIPCQSSCVGSQFLQAVGVAKGVALSGLKEVVYVSGGDGATSQGDFHEALNFAALHKLPVIFAVQDNGWAISVPVKEQTAGGSILNQLKGFEGLVVERVDGGDGEALYHAFSKAADRGMNGEGPTVLVCKVPRIGPHSNSDDQTKYRSVEEIELCKQLDPLHRLEKRVEELKIASKEEIETLREAVFVRMEKEAALAEALPFPDPKTVEENLFLPVTVVAEEKSSSRDSIVMVDALNKALVEEMERDDRVVVFGEDVAHGKGGVFGVTRNLTARFGNHRCFNTPLAESTIIALALGMSLVNGYKPVAEIQFADYLWPGINQLFNELSSFCYRSNGEWHAPVVIRMPYGGYIQGGPYHSQSIEAFLAHCPGLKVVIPSQASDAKRLLKTAIRDPNPVIFLEHKALYRQRLYCARPEPGEEELLPFGKANVVRVGSMITFVGWGMTVCMAAEVAEALSKEGIDIEIIDLRTIVPLDMETVIHSVKKTGKILIAHEAPRSVGFGAEVAARVVEKAFPYLDAPPYRIGGKECPVPYSKGLEEAVLPQKQDLERALKELYAY